MLGFTRNMVPSQALIWCVWSFSLSSRNSKDAKQILHRKLLKSNKKVSPQLFSQHFLLDTALDTFIRKSIHNLSDSSVFLEIMFKTFIYKLRIVKNSKWFEYLNWRRQVSCSNNNGPQKSWWKKCLKVTVSHIECLLFRNEKWIHVKGGINQYGCG